MRPLIVCRLWGLHFEGFNGYLREHPGSSSAQGRRQYGKDTGLACAMKSPDETTRSIRWGPSFMEFIELTQHGLNCMASFKPIESCISDFAKSLKAAVVDSRMDDILVRLVSFSSCESLALRSYESFQIRRLHLTPAAPIPQRLQCICMGSGEHGVEAPLASLAHCHEALSLGHEVQVWRLQVQDAFNCAY